MSLASLEFGLISSLGIGWSSLGGPGFCAESGRAGRPFLAYAKPALENSPNGTPNAIGIITVKKFRLFTSIINQLLSKKMLATVARSRQLCLQRKLHAPGRVNGIIPLPLSYD